MPTPIRSAIEQFCVDLAQDPLLVQGAGGNISWKEGQVLWVKASGTRFQNAQQQDIFTAVDYQHLRTFLDKGHCNVQPRLITSLAQARPSIETLLHALLPQKIVVHLHALLPLAYLIQSSAQKILQAQLAHFPEWTFIPYHQPGAELASAVLAHTKNCPAVKLLMLQNHGIVLAGKTVDEVRSLLGRLLAMLSDDMTMPQIPAYENICGFAVNGIEYSPIQDPLIHQLVYQPALYRGLQECWAICPDHVVFLGAKALCYTDRIHFQHQSGDSDDNGDKALRPDVIFIKDDGVFVADGFNTAQQEQLKAYLHTLSFLPSLNDVQVLNHHDIAALCNWDAEHYRQQLAK